MSLRLGTISTRLHTSNPWGRLATRSPFAWLDMALNDVNIRAPKRPKISRRFCFLSTMLLTHFTHWWCFSKLRRPSKTWRLWRSESVRTPPQSSALLKVRQWQSYLSRFRRRRDRSPQENSAFGSTKQMTRTILSQNLQTMKHKSHQSKKDFNLMCDNLS